MNQYDYLKYWMKWGMYYVYNIMILCAEKKMQTISTDIENRLVYTSRTQSFL